jgi:hypothetical protein
MYTYTYTYALYISLCIYKHTYVCTFQSPIKLNRGVMGPFGVSNRKTNVVHLHYATSLPAVVCIIEHKNTQR